MVFHFRKTDSGQKKERFLILSAILILLKKRKVDYDMKILSCVFEIEPASPLKNAEKMIAICKEKDAELCLFAAYALTGISALIRKKAEK